MIKDLLLVVVCRLLFGVSCVLCVVCDVLLVCLSLFAGCWLLRVVRLFFAV